MIKVHFLVRLSWKCISLPKSVWTLSKQPCTPRFHLYPVFFITRPSASTGSATSAH